MLDACVDSVIEDNSSGPLISPMTIDSCYNILGGSDHRSILFEVESMDIAEMH